MKIYGFMAMNVLVAQNIQSRIELEELSWLGNWMVSYQNHAPLFGCFQDSLIGSARLTKSNVEMNKWHSMMMFSNVITAGDNQGQGENNKLDFKQKNYTGREVVSKFLPPINYPKRKASSYLSQYAPYIKYEPDDIYIQINRGELISGSLDMSTVGQKVIGSIHHIINNEYGAKRALDTIFNFHQAVSRFFLYKGFTIGVKDINISEKATEEIKEKIAIMINSSREITEKLNKRQLIPPIGSTLKDFYEQQQMNVLTAGDDFVAPIFNDIDYETNALVQTVLTGSKGKKSNITAINGAIGTQTNGGERPRRNFSHGRTSPYFQRYDTEPVSLGYVSDSFREGLSPIVFPFVAWEARYGIISNALSTSVSGAQNRLSIKNLESILVDNLRRSAKNQNVVQIMYAESGIDPRKTEKVKFLTAVMSNQEMEENYHSKIALFPEYKNKQVQDILDSEFEQLMKDRQDYRDIFLKVEDNNPGQYVFENEQQMPINPFRIIEDVVYNYESVVENLSKAQTGFDPVVIIQQVRDLCENIGYTYYNNIQEDKKMIIPEYITQCITLLKILIRSYLNTSNLKKRGITNFHINIIITKIRTAFKNSLMGYGEAVGILAAQCISEPMTQYVLDSKHRTSGGGGTKTNTIERIKEILGAKSTDKMKNTSMTIMLKPEYETNKAKVQEIANYIEMMDLNRFTTVEQIFFEEYGKPVHKDYKHEVALIKEFEKYNVGINAPSNISKWCIRYELNREEMIINSMKLDTIITQLRIQHPDIYFIYTPENADHIVVRCYITHTLIKSTSSLSEETQMMEILRKLSNTVIRGVDNIINTHVINVAKSRVNEDGSIETIKVFGIATQGTNLEEIYDNPYVDIYRTQTDSIIEFEEMFGVDAARNKIIAELHKTMNSGDVIRTHTTLFGDEMTYSGSVTSIQKTGLQKREASSIALRLSFQSPIQIIEAAAEAASTDIINGISAPLILGTSPILGTSYNDVCINTEFVETYYKNLNKSLDEDL